MLKFYTDTKELTQENRKRVFPMLFDWFYLEQPLIKQYFYLVPTFIEADVCILPIDLGFYLTSNRKQEVLDFIALAKANHRKVWLYSAGDFGITWEDEAVTVFRLGGFNSKMNNNTKVMPSFVNDPYQSLFKKEWQAVQKKEKPTIGFVGNADGSLVKWSKEFFIYCKQSFNRFISKDASDAQSFFPSSTIRFQLLEHLKQSDKVETDFIYRNKYRAGASTEDQKSKTTLEFYENMERNLYTFCIRGSGNFSVRFYETLMMGRIPVLIDTDVRLPLDKKIKWEQHCVMANKDSFTSKLIAFHQDKSNDELIALQKSNRKLALEILNRQHYFINVVTA